MQTSVSLQDPLSYSWTPVLLIGAVILATIILYLILDMRDKKGKVNDEPKAAPPKDYPKIKNRYRHELDVLEQRMDNNSIEVREAYQKLSELVRGFVFEMTGIKTQNFTLTEIEKLNFPRLAEQIREYYKPEFEPESEGDMRNSLEKARGIIESWN